MSLRSALEALPDDRATVTAARQVVAFLDAHPHELVRPSRIARATGLTSGQVDTVIAALQKGFVVDCGGSEEPECVFEPTPLLALEVQRYLRAAPAGGDPRLQLGAQRFRSRFGR